MRPASTDTGGRVDPGVRGCGRKGGRHAGGIGVTVTCVLGGRIVVSVSMADENAALTGSRRAESC